MRRAGLWAGKWGWGDGCRAQGVEGLESTVSAGVAGATCTPAPAAELRSSLSESGLAGGVICKLLSAFSFCSSPRGGGGNSQRCCVLVFSIT